MSSIPRVSVLMVVRNGMPYIRQAVESLFGQTMHDWELIIADDGSTDQTPLYCRSLTDPRVRYFPLGQVGLVEARNFTLRTARAPLVAVLDADDLAMPERLQRQHEFLQEHPDCVLLGAQVEDVDPEGRPIGRREFPLEDEALRWRLFFGMPFIHPSSMFRREAALACGGYRPEFPLAEDYDLFTRLAEHGRLANLPQCLLRYRIHPKSLTSERLEVQLRCSAEVASQYALRYVPDINPTAVRDLYYFLCVDRDPQETTGRQMAEAFGKIRSGYLAHVPSMGEELRQEMSRTQQVLRWRCLERAEKHWRRPWRAWQWLRLAGQFDPDQGALGQIALRALKKCFRIKGIGREN